MSATKVVSLNPQAAQLAARLKKAGSVILNILGKKFKVNFNVAQMKINHIKGSVSVFIEELGQWLVFNLEIISNYLANKTIPEKYRPETVMVPIRLIS